MQIVDLMMRAVRRIRICSSAELAPVGLTHAQSRALRVVAGAGAPMRMADLAAALEIVPRAATTNVDALDQAGLVVRRTDSCDRRSVLVSLTPKGRKLLARLAGARRRAADRVLAPLSVAERGEPPVVEDQQVGPGRADAPAGHDVRAVLHPARSQPRNRPRGR